MSDSFFGPLGLDFAAKVRWRMRFDRNPLFVTLQDKHAVRQYAGLRGVNAPKLLYATDRPETIPFGSLPAEYMIKANHGCGWNILCHGGEFYRFGNGSSGMVSHGGSFLRMDSATNALKGRDEVVGLCGKWLSRTYSRLEWAYRQIPPRIIVEELLVPRDGAALKDYRFYAFDGEVKMIMVGSGLYRRNRELAIMDCGWNPFSLTSHQWKVPDPLPARPGSLGEMLDAARRLGEGIDFMRVDLYDTAQGVVLGEMTVYPHKGSLDTPTSCPVFNKWLGDQWKLSRADTAAAVCWNLIGGYRSR